MNYLRAMMQHNLHFREYATFTELLSNFLISCSRLYGPRCGGCGEGISPSELIRKAKDKVFHVKCFICQVRSAKLKSQMPKVINFFCRSAGNSYQQVKSSTYSTETSSYAKMITTISKIIKVCNFVLTVTQMIYILDKLLNSFKTHDGFHLMFEW